MSSEFRNRLAKGLEQHSEPAPHPATDVLSAYVEHVLPRVEEQEVLAHLSVCAACREVVFLASSAAEPESTPVAIAPSQERIRWWAWTVPLMAILIVGSTAIMLQSNRHSLHIAAPQTEMAQARRDAPLETSHREASSNAPQAVTPKISQPTKPDAPFQEKKEAEPQKSVAPALADRNETSLQALSADSTPPAAGPRFEFKAKGAASDSPPVAAPAQAGSHNETIRLTGEDAVVETQAAVPGKRIAAQNARMRTADEYSLSKKSVQKLDASGQWRVTPEGKVEHLLLGAWKPALAAPPNYFLTIISVGNDVWAGGKDLALYHSADSGLHWERQTLPAPPTDIVQIEFSSSTTGTLKTSSAGAFSTHDGGKAWAVAEGSLPPAP